MVIAYHLGGLLGAWVGIAGSVGTMAQSEMGGISGFLLYFRVFIALTHEWTDFVRLLVAVEGHMQWAIERSRFDVLVKLGLHR